MVPLGGVSPWAWATIVISCFVVCLLGLFAIGYLPTTLKFGKLEKCLWFIGIVAFFGWGILQMFPLDVDTIAGFQPKVADLYKSLFPSGKATISLSPVLTRKALITWFAYGLIIYTVAKYFASGTANLARMCVILAVLGSVQAGYGFLTFGEESVLQNAFRSGRFNGSFSGANSFGGLLAITIPITLGVILLRMSQILVAYKGSLSNAFQDPRLGRKSLVVVFWMSIGLTLQIISLVLSASKGSLLAMGITSLLFLLWFAIGTRGQKAGKAFLVLSLIGFTVFTIGFSSGYVIIWDRFADLAESDISMNGRLDIWNSSLEMAESHPLGVGPGSFPVGIQRFQSEMFGDRRVINAHNDYLQLFSEVGWIGMIPVLLLVLLYFRRVIGIFRPSKDMSVWLVRGLFFALLAGLLHAVVEYNLSSRPGVAVTFACVAGLLMAGTRSLRDTPKPKDDPQRRRASSSATSTSQKEKANGTGGFSGSDASVAAGGDALSSSSPSPSSPRTTRIEEESSVSPTSGRRRKRRRRQSSDDQPKSVFIAKMPFLQKLRLIACIALCAWLSVIAVRPAMAHIYSQKGWLGVGGSSDKYNWLQFRRAPPEMALPTLEKAVKTDPKDGLLHTSFARARILDFDLNEIQKQDEALLRMKDEASQRRAIAIMDRVMIPQRLALYKEVQPSFDKGVEYSPWSAQPHAFSGRFLCEAAGLTRDKAESQAMLEKGMLQLQTAAKLAPNHANTLLAVCHGWGMVYKSLRAQVGESVQKEMIEVGRKVMLMGTKFNTDVITSWYDAGVSFSEMAESGGLPITALWMVYDLYDRVDDRENSLSILNYIDKELLADNPDTGLPPRSDLDAHLLRWHLRLTSQRSKWQLRDGQFETYRNNLAQRQSAWLARADILVGLENKNEMGIKIALDRIEGRQGLPPEHALRLSRLESAAAVAPKLKPRLSELALNDDFQLISNAIWWTESSLKTESNDGILLYDARNKLARNDPGGARVGLLSFFTDRGVPFRFKHRIRWMLARSQEVAGFKPQAKKDYLRALKLCDQDPTLLQDLIRNGAGDEIIAVEQGGSRTVQQRLDDLTPKVPLGMNFKSRSVELTGFSAREITPSGKSRLTLYFRFWKRVPSDLQVHVSSQSPDGFSWFNRVIEFNSLDEVTFGGGDPQIGCVIPVEVEMPSYVRGDDARLLIRLMARSQPGRTLVTDEGLSRFESWNWRSHVEPYRPSLDE